MLADHLLNRRSIQVPAHRAETNCRDLTNVRVEGVDVTIRMDSEGRLTVDSRRLTVDQLEELARERSVRPLSDEECRQYLHSQPCPGRWSAKVCIVEQKFY
jgi:hypothetical protein